jgi:hypothetical protein
MSIVIESSQLGARLRSDANELPGVIQRAMFSAAQRGKAFIVSKSPVDRGILKNAWRVVKMSDGVMLINDQPYAGVMEQGARPFKISREGREALAAWVMRKLLNGSAQVRNAGRVSKRKYLPLGIAQVRSTAAQAQS